MNDWTSLRVLLCLTEYFTGNDSNIPFAKQHEAQQILDWIALYPTEVGMRQLTCLISYIPANAAELINTSTPVA